MLSEQAWVNRILDTYYKSAIIPAEQEEFGKAQLCRQVAYEMNLVDDNIGLLKKTGGNNVLDMSVDIIMDKRDGSWADVVSSEQLPGGLVRIKAVWVGHPPDIVGWQDLWVKPTLKLANTAGPMQLVNEPPAEPDEPAQPGDPDQPPPATNGPKSYPNTFSGVHARMGDLAFEGFTKLDDRWKVEDLRYQALLVRVKALEALVSRERSGTVVFGAKSVLKIDKIE